ncbi:MAG: hypothetical protein GY820_11880 [Gammaproteobacteria bacterium]|nr:hypothetical protein [Gammaproteobacteria bacterium]
MSFIVSTGLVTFRYTDSDTKKTKIRKEPAIKFLWLVLQHVLPRGFRRARNYGFLHPNSKTLITLIQLLLNFDAKRWLQKPNSQGNQSFSETNSASILLSSRA